MTAFQRTQEGQCQGPWEKMARVSWEGDDIISGRVTWEGGGRTARLKVASQHPGLGGGVAAPACGRSEKEMLDSWGTVASEGQTKGQELNMETRKWSERKEKGQRAVTRPGNVKGRSN